MYGLKQLSAAFFFKIQCVFTGVFSNCQLHGDNNQ